MLIFLHVNYLLGKFNTMNLLEFDFITPFYLGAKDIFEQLFKTNINVSDIKEIKTDSNIDDISVSLDLKSNTFQGKVYYFMSSSFVITVLNVMIGEIAELDLESEMTRSAILELNNMITGKALMRLSDMGTSYNMGVPEITVGKGKKIFETPLPMSSVVLDNGREKFNVCFLTSHVDKIVNVKRNVEEVKKPLPPTISSNTEEKKEQPKVNTDNIDSYLKNTLVSSIDEIKNLSGDNEFLLRKTQTIAQISDVLVKLLSK
ncbi:MAG: chemotaxis protein CheX [Candidatus Sericytochromatia bacterium]